MIGDMTSLSRRKIRSHAPANAATTTADDSEETLPRQNVTFEGAWHFFHLLFFRLKINLLASKRSSLCSSVATALFCWVGVAQRQRLLWSSTSSTHQVRKVCSNNSSINSNNYGMTRCNFPPRYVRHIVDDVTLNSHVERLDLTLNVVRMNRKLNVNQERERQESLGNREPFETHDCKAQHAWQIQTHPTCNLIYEWDMLEDAVDLLAHGFWRDVWTAREEATGELRILKTLRYNHSFTTVNYERHRRDAMAMERLTSSLYVVDIYAYCSNSGMFEYGNGGDIMDAIWPPGNNQTSTLAGLDKLSIATQAAMGVTSVHNIDKEGQASIAHTDISPGQFIRIDGIYKLNDFNRARFIRWSPAENKACGYRVARNPGTNRSPEEYESLEQTEKVDVYSLGNLLYMLLQEEWPFQDLDEKEVKEQVIKGVRPSFDDAVWNSADPVDQALKAAMMMCHLQSPSERASARQVTLFLQEKLNTLYPGTLSSWEAKATAKWREKKHVMSSST